MDHQLPGKLEKRPDQLPQTTDSCSIPLNNFRWRKCVKTAVSGDALPFRQAYPTMLKFPFQMNQDRFSDRLQDATSYQPEPMQDIPWS
jgi:hypothetical protein